MVAINVYLAERDGRRVNGLILSSQYTAILGEIREEESVDHSMWGEMRGGSETMGWYIVSNGETG